MTAGPSLDPLWKLDRAELVRLVNQAFEDYFVPVHFNEASLLTHLQQNGVGWELSQTIRVDNHPVGVILIARRGSSLRVAMMCVLPEYRYKGLGSDSLGAIIIEARQRGDKHLELEVIVENTPAVHLYRKHRFQTVQHLLSFERTHRAGISDHRLERVDILQVAKLIAAYGAQDLPWQLSGETIAQFGPPARAYHLNGAFAVISDPSQATITLHSLIVIPDRRGEGRANALLGALQNEYMQCSFRVPALCPERFESFFDSSGFLRGRLSQIHMRRDL